MLEELDSHDLMELRAYDQLEPIGSQHLDIIAARLCSVLFATAIMSSGSKNKPTPPSPAKFLEGWDAAALLVKRLEEEERKNSEELANAATALVQVSVGKLMNVYEGDAPPIRRLGKKAAKHGSKRRKKLDAVFNRV